MNLRKFGPGYYLPKVSRVGVLTVSHSGSAWSTAIKKISLGISATLTGDRKAITFNLHDQLFSETPA